MSIDSKVIVKRLYGDVWNKRKLEVVSDLFSPSHALRDNNFNGSSVGPEAYKIQVALYLAAFPDLRFEIEDTVAEKDKFVASWTVTGTHKGEFMGIRPTHRKVTFEGITIHYLANGKIIDSNVSWDSLGLMRQLGVFPSHAQHKGAAPR